MTGSTIRTPDGPWRSWYGLGRWQVLRAHQLKVEPLCRICLLDGRVTVATIADHIKEHGGDWNEFWTGKLQSLCGHCHESRKKIAKSRGFRTDIGEDGYPLDPRHPAYSHDS